MDTLKYWKEKHKIYASEEWIKMPTLFAQFAVKYFPEKGKLLELGAGQGQDSRFFAAKGFKVLATDFSPDALTYAKKMPLKNLSFKIYDLNDPLPFKHNTFDIVYSHLSVQYFERQRTIELFNEIANVLKPAGILAMLLNTLDDPEVLQSEKIEKGLYKTPSGLVKRFYTIEDIEEFTKNNFTNLVLDNKGETYKDSIRTLVRYIGKKII